MESVSFLAKRILLFLLLYFAMLLLAQTRPVKSAIAHFHCFVGNIVVGQYVGGGQVKHRVIKPAEQASFPNYDLLVQMTSERQQEIAIAKAKQQGKNSAQISPLTYPVNSWVKLGLFFSFFFALTLVTPMSTRHKIIALLLGFISLTFLVALQTWVSVGTKFARYYEDLQAGFSSPAAVSVVRRIDNIIQYMGFSLLFAFVIWAILCVPRLKLPTTQPAVPRL